MFPLSLQLWLCGDKYDGQWVAGKMHGHGIKKMANGDIYDGEWRYDKAHGFGIKKFVCGDRHEGIYQADKRHGYGKYFFANGDRFEGFWVDGEQLGKGSYYYNNGDVFRGFWVDGKKNGKGISSNASDSYKEVWDHGVLCSRKPCKYYPRRLLKTRAEIAQDPEEANRIQQEILKLQSRLATINTNTDPLDLTVFNTSKNNLSNVNDSTSSTASTTSESSTNSSTTSSAQTSPRGPVASLADSAPLSPSATNLLASSSSSSPSTESEALSESQIESQAGNNNNKRSGEDAPDQCKVCYDASINTVLIRCGHMCVCLGCSMMLEKCPVCRSEIDEVIQTFKA